MVDKNNTGTSNINTDDNNDLMKKTKDTDCNINNDSLYILGSKYKMYKNQEIYNNPANNVNNDSYDETNVISKMYDYLVYSFQQTEYNTEVLGDIHSRINFTYRTEFEPIKKITGQEDHHALAVLLRGGPMVLYNNILVNNGSFTTDIGWGCMIRTGQSLLANALQIIHLGRDYRRNGNDEKRKNKENEILSWFNDRLENPFSIQNFVRVGWLLSKKKPGEWFSPSATARSIHKLICDFPNSGIDYCLISTDSATIYVEDIESFFKNHPETYNNGNTKTMLILCCVRLGINEINKCYWNEIKRILSLENISVGISGGRPSSSYYFFGVEEDYLLYLDPHNPQEACVNAVSFAESAHGEKFNKIHLSQVDPSMMLGFIIQGKESWQIFQEQMAGSNLVQITSRKHIEDASFVIEENSEDTSFVCDHEEDARTKSVEAENDSNKKGLQTDTSSLVDVNTRVAQNNYFETSDDYVDVGLIFSLKNKKQPSKNGDDIEEDFQKINCKNQKIVILDDNDESQSFDNAAEEENVLCEQDTVTIYK